MLWAGRSLRPAEPRAAFACFKTKKTLLKRVEILFVPLRGTNEKDLHIEGLFSRDRRGLNSQPPASFPIFGSGR